VQLKLENDVTPLPELLGDKLDGNILTLLSNARHPIAIPKKDFDKLLGRVKEIKIIEKES
jgi:hypothetical protein